MAVTSKLALGYIGLMKQSVQGTGVFTSPKYFVLINHDFRPSQVINEIRTGNQRDLSIAVKEEFIYKGSFQTYLYADEGAALLAWLMGTDTKTGSGDPYTHTMSFTEPLPYLTAEVGIANGGEIDRVIDCKISKLEIEFTARKEIFLTVHLLGCSVAVQGSASTPSFSNGAGEGPMRHADAAFTLTGPTDASTIAGQIQTLKLTIDQGVVDQPGPGQVTPIALVEEGRRVSFTGTALYTSDNLQRLGFYGSSSGSAVSSVVATGSLSVLCTSVAASPGPERSALFTVAQNWWTLIIPPFDKDGKTAMIGFEATAYRSGATLPFSSVFKNGVSTSYTA